MGLYSAGEGTRLYDRYGCLNTSESTLVFAYPTPTIRKVYIDSTFTTPRSSPVTNMFSLTYFTALSGALQSALKKDARTSALAYP